MTVRTPSIAGKRQVRTVDPSSKGGGAPGFLPAASVAMDRDVMERTSPAGRHRGAARLTLQDVHYQRQPTQVKYLSTAAVERARHFVAMVATYDGPDPMFSKMAANLRRSA